MDASARALLTSCYAKAVSLKTITIFISYLLYFSNYYLSIICSYGPRFLQATHLVSKLHLNAKVCYTLGTRRGRAYITATNCFMRASHAYNYEGRSNLIYILFFLFYYSWVRILQPFYYSRIINPRRSKSNGNHWPITKGQCQRSPSETTRGFMIIKFAIFVPVAKSMTTLITR